MQLTGSPSGVRHGALSGRRGVPSNASAWAHALPAPRPPVAPARASRTALCRAGRDGMPQGSNPYQPEEFGKALVRSRGVRRGGWGAGGAG
eukprot:364254-Chlamydomonas_euryale.AAC.7